MYDYNDTEWDTVYSEYTLIYKTSTGEVICSTTIRKPEESPELGVGDTAALDDFLGEFARKVE